MNPPRGEHPDVVLYDEIGWARDDELFASLLASQASVADPLALVDSRRLAGASGAALDGQDAGRGRRYERVLGLERHQPQSEGHTEVSRAATPDSDADAVCQRTSKSLG